MSTAATRDPAANLDPLDFPTMRAYRLASGDARRREDARRRIQDMHSRNRRLSPEEISYRVGVSVERVTEVLADSG